MYRPAIGIILAAATALGGCAQSTRHSNTMIFGANTVFGISAGADATSTPSVTVGYKRQEAVVLPLYANTGVDGANGELLKPCDSGDADVIIACKFQGTGDGKDTYSVLASFGAKFVATMKDSPTASGEIAQYFATGHAARALASRAGAAAVSTGDAAKASVYASTAMKDRVAAVDVDALQARLTAAQGSIGAKVFAAGDAGYRAVLQAMDNKIEGSTFTAACPVADTASACAARLVRGDGLRILDPVELEAAAAS